MGNYRKMLCMSVYSFSTSFRQVFYLVDRCGAGEYMNILDTFAICCIFVFHF